MKTVAIDCRFAHLENAGIGRYTREVVAELLLRDDPLSYVLIALPEARAWVASLPVRADVRCISANHYSLAEQWRIPSFLRRISPDLFFAPHFNVPLRCPVPFVVTIHDLILHRFPNEASLFRQIAYRAVIGHALRASRSVVAVSRFTASELRAVYGDAIASKVTVIPEGYSRQFRPADPDSCRSVRERYDLRMPFFLYVGNAKQHKKVQSLIDEFHQADTDADLILVTSGREADALRLGSRVRIIRSVDAAELCALYTSSLGFVTASEYEGFCLPAAEAAACGCPIIAPRSGAIPEVVPPSSMLFGPEEHALARVLRVTHDRPAPWAPRSWADVAAETSQALLRALA